MNAFFFLLIALICVIHASCSGNISESVDGPTTEEEKSWMIPGTKWCGPGNIAVNISDLGIYNETDKCCRAHDRCNVTIPALFYKWGIFNQYLYTMSHCDCEEKFHQCLKDVDNAVSRSTGMIYFKLLRPSCFRLVEKKVCAKFAFDIWRFKFVCQRYHMKKVATKFKAQEF